MRRVDVGGLSLSCAVAGKGPLVILLHGFPQSSHAWRHQIPALAERFTVAAPDLRGYGESDKPPRVMDYAVDKLAGDIAGLIRALGFDKAHVVGHDWGGSVAWHLAITRPKSVDRLAVINCPHPSAFGRVPKENPRQLLRSWYMFAVQPPWLPERLLLAGDCAILRRMFRRTTEQPGCIGDADADAYRDGLSAPGAMRAALNYYRAAFREAPAAILHPKPMRRISAPALLIWGEQDRFLGKELTFGMERFFSGPFRVQYLPDASHWVMEEQPELVSRVLLEHVEG